MKILTAALICVSLMASSACHPGPVFNRGPKQRVGGTIAGIVSTTSGVALPGRTITAIDVTTGARFTAITGSEGGYTIEVPRGTYRIEVELAPKEAMARRPEPTEIKRSDVDAG